MYVAYSEDRLFKEIGNTRQLFIDDDVVAVVKNVTRRRHTPRKHPNNPLIVNDKPWEVNPYFRTSNFNVRFDPMDGLFKCWFTDFFRYFGIPKSEYGLDTLHSRHYYAQSKDGISWEKPPLGKHFVDGHDTNTVFCHPPYQIAVCPSVLLDEHETDPSRRYKMTYLFHSDPSTADETPGGHHADGLSIAFSPNGIDWTPYEHNPIIPTWIGDVSILTYDDEDGKYVMYGRAGGAGGRSNPDFDRWFHPVWPGRPEGIWGTRRRVYRVESRDAISWSDPVLVFDPGPDDNLDDGHYGFVPWRAGEMHLGILNVLHQVDNTLDMYPHHSRDGLDWKRFQYHRPLVPRGGEGSYDEFDIESPTQPLVVGDELWFYYGGMSVHHDWWIMGQEEGLDAPEVRDRSLSQNGHHLCLATLRLDGLVSLGATIREGYVETKPFRSDGARLFINAQCRPGGYVEVEVMDHWNNVSAGYSRDECHRFTGDSVRHRVRWASRDTVDEAALGAKLRVHLKNAELYGFQFE